MIRKVILVLLVIFTLTSACSIPFLSDAGQETLAARIRN